jgi:hypothetical protein
MDLIFNIAKHYWLKRENATWSVSESFDQKALAWFKDQYSLLEERRPGFKEFQHKTVFFFYSDAQDIYGRNITEIAAILVDVLFRSPDSVQTLISHHLKKIPPADLDFTVFIDDSDIIKPQISCHVGAGKRKKAELRKWLITASAICLVLVGIILFMFSSGEDALKTSSEQSVPQADNALNSDRIDHENSKASPFVSVPTTVSQPSKQHVRNEFCKKFNKIRYKTEKEKKLREQKCFSSYIEHQCGTGVRMPYDKWLENNRSGHECEYVKSCSSDVSLKAWIESQHNQNLIKAFFSGK